MDKARLTQILVLLGACHGGLEYVRKHRSDSAKEIYLDCPTPYWWEWLYLQIVEERLELNILDSFWEILNQCEHETLNSEIHRTYLEEKRRLVEYYHDSKQRYSVHRLELDRLAKKTDDDLSPLYAKFAKAMIEQKAVIPWTEIEQYLLTIEKGLDNVRI
jgi:hypothetical protein